MNDLISREALKNAVEKRIWYIAPAYDEIMAIIDNAPTVEINTNDIEYKVYCKGLEDGKKIARPQGEITNEDIQQAIKEGFANGYEMAKEKIIHSIAKQYSEHNELVPMWLSIGDIKDGAE